MDAERETTLSQGGESSAILPRGSGELAEEKVSSAKPVVELPDAKNLYSLAVSFAKSGMFPHAKNPFGAMTIIEYGRELGIPPVSALQTMSVVNGRLAIEAKALFAIALKHGVTIEVIEKTKERCVLRFRRPGYEPYVETFTIEDAKRIGLLSKDNWQKYPEEMNYWRCGAKGLRAYCSDIILGLYTKEELEDIAMPKVSTSPTTTSATTNVAPNVEVIDLVPEAPEPTPPSTSTATAQAVSQPASTSVETPVEPVAEQDVELEASIALINTKIEGAGLDRQRFLGWLYSIQAPKRLYVGKLYNNFSLHQGDRKDVIELARTIDRAIATYKKQAGMTTRKEVANGKKYGKK